MRSRDKGVCGKRSGQGLVAAKLPGLVLIDDGPLASPRSKSAGGQGEEARLLSLAPVTRRCRR